MSECELEKAVGLPGLTTLQTLRYRSRSVADDLGANLVWWDIPCSSTKIVKANFD
jgi:hypothetical protein